MANGLSIERLMKNKILAAGLGLIALGVLASMEFGNAPIVSILIVLGGLGFAIGIISEKRR